MGLSKWLKELGELADAKREIAVAKESARLKEVQGAFGASCQWLVDIESAENVDITGSPLAVIPRLDGFGAEVSRMIPTAKELVVRLQGADPSTAPDILAEFGLAGLSRIDPSRLTRILDAAEVLVEGSQSLVREWPISGEEDRQMQAADVAEAAKRLLFDTGRA